MRLYASEHPDSVVGLVLVDSSQEDEVTRFSQILTPDVRANWLRQQAGHNKEYINVIASLEQLRTTHLAPSLLLTVLSAQPQGAGQNELETRLEKELQQNLAQLLPTGKHIIVKNSGHFIQNDQPQIVVQAIHEMVSTARTNKH